MKKYKLNPKVKKLNLTFETSIQKLETEGFDFDQYHENRADAERIDFEEARARNYSEYSARIFVAGSIESPETMVCWYHHQSNQNTEREDTGDDEQTVKDIISILEGGQRLYPEWDMSEDIDGNYVPTFVVI
jgi:hypothetical protein